MLFLLLLLAQLPRLPRAQPPPPPLPAAVYVTITSTVETGRASGLPGQKPPAETSVVRLKAGEKPGIRWGVSILDARKPLKEIVVHLVVRRNAEDAAGTPQPATIETALATDHSAAQQV